MRYVATLLVLFAFAPAKAQLNPDLSATALRYFVSLPYGKEVLGWVQEVGRDTSLLHEGGEPNKDIFYRGRLKRTALVPDADSSGVAIGPGFSFSSRRVRAGSIYYVLHQSYRVPKGSITWSEWRKRCLAIVHAFSGQGNIQELNIKSDGKWKVHTVRDWNHTSPDIVIMFGDLDSPYWHLVTELHFDAE
ncbi:MAG: hypothetical protein EOO11_11270 [Chitinophagaceae bacterium]|nr:MAG: hypothetical protein EOO11_11270 [Chitinophagaceae bacterium]